MVQIHRRLSVEQVRVVLEGYQSREILLGEALSLLGVGRSRFFALLAEYQNDPATFTLMHKGNPGNRKIGAETEALILVELQEEEKLITNRMMPIRHYNYSAVKDILLEKHGLSVSLPTIIARAKQSGFYLKKPPRKVHDREVLTTLIGELVQHDSSLHQWSPYMEKKLYLITSIDDHSRLLLYAEFVERESSWTHICALQKVFLQYGAPMKYYADQHSIFRYVKDRDKFRPSHIYTKFTDDVDTQWRQVLKECQVTPLYALSPEAKGKVERPYRWLQDRVVRTAAKEGVDTVEGVRAILKDLVTLYNTKWVHSTTKEIPVLRFERAQREKRSLFTPLTLQKDQALDDVFSLKIERVVDAYRKISLHGCSIQVPNATPRDRVTLKMVPDEEKGLVKIRFWREEEFLGEGLQKLSDLPIVQF